MKILFSPKFGGSNMENIFHGIPFLDIKKSNTEFITFEMWFIIYIRYIPITGIPYNDKYLL